MPESVNFDRMADRYDETRGGEERGRTVAAALAPHLLGETSPEHARLLEIGVGTGLISAAFAELGWSVAGVDLSERMLAHAAVRLPGRVVRADATALPLRTGTVDACIAVHVLHLVGDQPAVLAEVARVLRPGGRFGFVGAGAPDGSDVSEVIRAMHATLSGSASRRDAADTVTGLAERAGMHPIADHTVTAGGHTATPLEAARQIELRTWSSLWDIPAAKWSSIVEPALEALRGLPNPTETRPATIRTPCLTFENRAPGRSVREQ
ncbi:class I SAM-dependent methyltransferase [Parafrankia discariae]|uniref:class I SAM-dependent methyltransferase n=1 Tax=Parafrankia discariae TaxID=365528 RepID=UPI0003643FE1|nr:class I SAM-dependent methyltransferase [Parafrankia discariae]